MSGRRHFFLLIYVLFFLVVPFSVNANTMGTTTPSYIDFSTKNYFFWEGRYLSAIVLWLEPQDGFYLYSHNEIQGKPTNVSIVSGKMEIKDVEVFYPEGNSIRDKLDPSKRVSVYDKKTPIVILLPRFLVGRTIFVRTEGLVCSDTLCLPLRALAEVTVQEPTELTNIKDEKWFDAILPALNATFIKDPNRQIAFNTNPPVREKKKPKEKAIESNTKDEKERQDDLEMFLEKEAEPEIEETMPEIAIVENKEDTEKEKKNAPLKEKIITSKKKEKKDSSRKPIVGLKQEESSLNIDLDIKGSLLGIKDKINSFMQGNGTKQTQKEEKIEPSKKKEPFWKSNTIKKPLEKEVKPKAKPQNIPSEKRMPTDKRIKKEEPFKESNIAENTNRRTEAIRKPVYDSEALQKQQIENLLKEKKRLEKNGIKKKNPQEVERDKALAYEIELEKEAWRNKNIPETDNRVEEALLALEKEQKAKRIVEKPWETQSQQKDIPREEKPRASKQQVVNKRVVGRPSETEDYKADTFLKETPRAPQKLVTTKRVLEQPWETQNSEEEGYFEAVPQKLVTTKRVLTQSKETQGLKREDFFEKNPQKQQRNNNITERPWETQRQEIPKKVERAPQVAQKQQRNNNITERPWETQRQEIPKKVERAPQVAQKQQRNNNTTERPWETQRQEIPKKVERAPQVAQKQQRNNNITERPWETQRQEIPKKVERAPQVAQKQERNNNTTERPWETQRQEIPKKVEKAPQVAQKQQSDTSVVEPNIPEILDTEESSVESDTEYEDFMKIFENVRDEREPGTTTKKVIKKEDTTKKAQLWKFTPLYIQEILEVETLTKGLLFAFLAGFILNFMPCVFPVITLKFSSLLGIVSRRNFEIEEYEVPDSVHIFRIYNIFFCLGIMTFFALLGIIMYSTGAVWGRIFQIPEALLIVAAIIFLLALSLFGVFDIPVFSTRIGTSGTAMYQAFMTGMLTTLLATPCSAPLLGGVLSWLIQQPQSHVMIVLMAMSLGMILPYIVFIIFPTLITKLPRPGVWNIILEALVAFFLIGTTIYLLSLLPQLWLIPSMIILFVLSIGAWIWGRSTGYEYADVHNIIIRLIIVLVLSVVIFWILQPSAVTLWEKFDRKTFNSTLSQEIMLVNFTADWCPNCKVLEQTVLTPQNMAKWQKQYGVRFIKVDLTRENKDGEELLASLKSNSIPLLAIFPKNSKAYTPLVLRDIYTAKKVESALRKSLE